MFAPESTNLIAPLSTWNFFMISGSDQMWAVSIPVNIQKCRTTHNQPSPKIFSHIMVYIIVKRMQRWHSRKIERKIYIDEEDARLAYKDHPGCWKTVEHYSPPQDSDGFGCSMKETHCSQCTWKETNDLANEGNENRFTYVLSLKSKKLLRKRNCQMQFWVHQYQ